MEKNPVSPDLHRAEVVALRVLPEECPAPRLPTSYDGGDRVALVLEDVPGRRQSVPWRPSDVRSVTSSRSSTTRAAAQGEKPPTWVTAEATVEPSSCSTARRTGSGSWSQEMRGLDAAGTGIAP
ncbi:MAG: hypothetical protein ACRDWY_17335 [Actinomycetes bacterium]